MRSDDAIRPIEAGLLQCVLDLLNQAVREDIVIVFKYMLVKGEKSLAEMVVVCRYLSSLVFPVSPWRLMDFIKLFEILAANLKHNLRVCGRNWPALRPSHSLIRQGPK